MIEFEGDRSFPIPVAEAAAKLSDAGFLVGCLPDANVSEATPERALWKLKPKVSYLTGSLDATMMRTEHLPGSTVTFRIVAKAMGASSTVATRLEFRASATGTAVHWKGELIEVTGLLKMVPKGLLQSTAEKVIEDVWVAVSEKLTGG